MEEFNAQEFVEKQVKEIRKIVGTKRTLIAVSGGVDSTTCAALTHRALGENLLCVMLDDAFMREGEPERVARVLSNPPLNLPIKVVNVQSRFLDALKGLSDAEEKRKKFREIFYKTLSETAEKESCLFLVQGTIKPDILETAGGIKTQHNILAQIGISPIEHYNFQIIEPLTSLYKPQVRQVARYLGIPSEMSERQPFPGPGLSVRVVGEIKLDKLESLKKATTIAEEKLAKHQPEQYFSAIIDNTEKPQDAIWKRVQEIVTQFLNVKSSQVTVKILKEKATGIRDGLRNYGEIVAVKVQENSQCYQPPIQNLVALQEKIVNDNKSLARVLYMVQEKLQKKPYLIAIRAIQTHDFMTAKVSEIPWVTLNEITEEILKACLNVSSVCYDVTPKPPATIEME